MTLMMWTNRVLHEFPLFVFVWCVFILGLLVFKNACSPSFYRLRFIPGDALLLMGICVVVIKIGAVLTS